MGKALYYIDTARNATTFTRGAADAAENGLTRKNGVEMAASGLGLAANASMFRTVRRGAAEAEFVGPRMPEAPGAGAAGGTRAGVDTFWKRWTNPHPDQSAVFGQVGDTCGLNVVEMTLAKQGIKLSPAERQAFQKAFLEKFAANEKIGIRPEEVAELLQSAGVKVPPSANLKVPYSVAMGDVEAALSGPNGAIVQIHRAEGGSHFVIVEKVISPSEAAKLGLPQRQGTLVQIVDSNEASRFYATLEELQLHMSRGGRYKYGTVIPLP